MSYQLDAFVFFDQLQAFVDMDYDWIGAPWELETRMQRVGSGPKCMLPCGNGGFSLRDTRACLRVLAKHPIAPTAQLLEDSYFSYFLFSDPDGRLAPLDVARRFSSEFDAERIWRKNGYQLPFGCHGWNRYSADFYVWAFCQVGYDIRSARPFLRDDDCINVEWMLRRWKERHASEKRADVSLAAAADWLRTALGRKDVDEAAKAIFYAEPLLRPLGVEQKPSTQDEAFLVEHFDALLYHGVKEIEVEGHPGRGIRYLKAWKRLAYKYDKSSWPELYPYLEDAYRKQGMERMAVHYEAMEDDRKTHGGQTIMKLSIIIATRNSVPQTKTCLASLSGVLPDVPVEIIAIDNGSTDGTRALLTSLTDVRTIFFEENRGASAAWNAGAAQATGDLLLLTHNDAFFTRHSIERMMAALQAAPEAGAVGPYTNRSRFCRADGLAYRTADELARAAETLATEAPSYRDVLVLDGPCMLVPRTVFERIGGFDEAFPLAQLAAFDFSFRLHQEGFHSYLANAYVHHNGDSYAENHLDFRAEEQKLEPAFRAKWGTSPEYSTYARNDLLAMMDVERPGIRVLEAGCACGADLMAIGSRNPTAELYGIEINEKTASVARCYGEVSAEDLEQLDRPEWDGTFDYILAGDVIEHLRDPWAAVRHFARLLKPGGALVASVPNVAHISNVYQLLQGRWDYEDAGILDRTHLRFFTKKTLREMLEQAGFTIHAMGSNSARMDPQCIALVQALLALPEVSITEEELLAYQWLVDARRE